MDYFEQLCLAMKMLSEHPRTVFLGQAVAYDGTAMFKTFRDVPQNKRIELPVTEDMQMGMATGMSLGGFIPICSYPRINFLLLAISQLVLHLDKMEAYTHNEHKPVVIVRTSIGTPLPLNPGHQHLGDYTLAIKRMLTNVHVESLILGEDIVPAYQTALKSRKSTILIERMALYGQG